MTVLFADAVDSTSTAALLGEEEMYALMQACLARMMAAVRAYEGHVASFTGDGIMAVFGAPVAHEETGSRAVAAALRMQRSLEEEARELRARHSVDWRFRVGINTGPVVVGEMSDELKMEFTAIGDTVNLAARMQTLAEPGSVYVTEATFREVSDQVICRAVGPLIVKGKQTPIPAWRVLGERPARTRLERAVERGLAPFVGRSEELHTLQFLVEEVRRGKDQTVLVSGDAGAGKSRLLLELRRRLGTETRWLQGHCRSFGSAVPYHPIVDLLRRAFGVDDGDDEATIVNRIESVTSSWSEPSRATIPYLRLLLSVDVGDEAVASLSPRDRRSGILDGLRALLEEESAQSSLVVAFEDLQWVDDASEQVLGMLVEGAPHRSVLLVLTYRTGYVPALGQNPTTSLVLKPLRRDDNVALALGLLHTESLPPELCRFVPEKAEGNPFFTEEILRSLLEAGALIRSETGYVLTSSLNELHIPSTVYEVILSRLDRLPAPAKEALQLASVIGRDFNFRVLDAVSEFDGLLGTAFTDLKAADLISEKAYLPELVYSFKHTLTHEVAYATLLTERRRTLHRAVALSIESLYVDRLAEHYESLAHHYTEGQEWEKAIEYLSKAGAKAAATYANEEALNHYTTALEICESIDSLDPRTVVTLAQRRALVSFTIGQFSNAATDMNRVVAVARRLGDRSLEGTALAHRGLCEFYDHRLTTSEATLQEAIAAGGEEDDDEVRAMASCYLSVLYTVEGRHAEARQPLEFVRKHSPALRDPLTLDFWAFFDSRLALWEGQPNLALQKAGQWRAVAQPDRSAWLRCWWNEAHARATFGDYDGARALLEETLAQCERVGDALTLMRCLNTMGYVHAELYDFDAAMEWNVRSLEMATSANAPVPEVEMNARLNLAENLLGRGELEDAERHFGVVEHEVRQPRTLWMHWRYAQRFFHGFGERCLALGETRKALALAAECLASAEQSASRKNVVKALRLRGQALLAENRLKEAELELSAALALAREVRSPPQLWQTLVAIGDVWKIDGRDMEARRWYADALSVIDAVASELADYNLRHRFLASRQVQRIRRAAQAPTQRE